MNLEATGDWLRNMVVKAVNRPGGASAREIRDSIKLRYRKDISNMRDQMVQQGLILCAKHKFEGHHRASERYCATEEQAGNWKAQQTEQQTEQRPTVAKPLKSAKRGSVALRRDAPVKGNEVKPLLCPGGIDHRYTVRELPKGYVSKLNPAECSPWAKAVSERA